MKTITKELLDKVNEEHDWDIGLTHSKGGTTLTRRDTCRICSISRSWFDDKQNDIHNRYTFRDVRGNEISLREAAEADC